MSEKTAYFCPFCEVAMFDTAAAIVTHCKKSHGKTVKAVDCQSPRCVKQTEWFESRGKLAQQFKRGKSK
jgi:hypothetical protein